MNLPGLFFITVGLFAMAGAIFNWDWFMNSRKARFMVRILTRNGARIFYSFLGLTLFILGLLGTIGIIDMSN
ncbi:MAG: immunity 17 family protein [Xenococcaceae cyanobacterium MO_188.B29]|nr:immunity 17 family protein [Xenococcaceae cyanobacterium MO_188.B29]